MPVPVPVYSSYPRHPELSKNAVVFPIAEHIIIAILPSSISIQTTFASIRQLAASIRQHSPVSDNVPSVSDNLPTYLAYLCQYTNKNICQYHYQQNHLPILECKIPSVEQIIRGLPHSRTHHHRHLTLIDQHLHQSRHLLKARRSSQRAPPELDDCAHHLSGGRGRKGNRELSRIRSPRRCVCGPDGPGMARGGKRQGRGEGGGGGGGGVRRVLGKGFPIIGTGVGEGGFVPAQKPTTPRTTPMPPPITPSPPQPPTRSPLSSPRLPT